MGKMSLHVPNREETFVLRSCTIITCSFLLFNTVLFEETPRRRPLLGRHSTLRVPHSESWGSMALGTWRMELRGIICPVDSPLFYIYYFGDSMILGQLQVAASPVVISLDEFTMIPTSDKLSFYLHLTFPICKRSYKTWHYRTRRPCTIMTLRP